MTEAEWRTGTDPEPMLEFVRGTLGGRKVRLFACACCRHIWHLITDDRCRRAVELAEAFADGEIAADDFGTEAQTVANREYDIAWHRSPPTSAADAGYQLHEVGVDASAWADACLSVGMFDGEDILEAAALAAQAAAHAAEPLTPATAYHDNTPVRGAARAVVRATQAEALRCVVGNPFRPVAFLPTWRSDTALSLARQMYDARDFSAMPILADALQDAGCEDADVLEHCRSGGGHVRGCWVVDGVRGEPGA